MLAQARRPREVSRPTAPVAGAPKLSPALSAPLPDPFGSRRECGACGGTCPKCRAPVDPAERQADEIGRRIAEDLAAAVPVGHGTLPESVQRVAEHHLGVPLEGVRLEAEAAGHEKAKSEAALAVTEGREIAFGPSQLSTSTRAGRQLLGHELVHVAQQASARSVRQRQPDPKAPQAERPEGLPANPKDVTLEYVRSLVTKGDLGGALYVIRGRSMAQMLGWLEGIAGALGPAGQATFKSAAAGAGGPRLRLAVLLSYAPTEIAESDWLDFARLGAATRAVILRYANAKGAALPINRVALEWAVAKGALRDMMGRPPAGLDPADVTLADAKADLSAALAIPVEVGTDRAALIEACAATVRRATVYSTAVDAMVDWAKVHRVTDASGRIKRCVVPMRRGADVRELDLSAPARHTFTGEVAPRIEVLKRQECCAAEPYVAAEGACTIGYGHVVKNACKPTAKKGVPALCPGASGSNRCAGTKTLCECSPPMGFDEATAERTLRADFQNAVKTLQKSVPLDLNDEQMFAFADLMVHGIPLSNPVGRGGGRSARDFLDVAYQDLCEDDDAARSAYQTTGTGTTGAPEVSHRARREARVWSPTAPKGAPKTSPRLADVVPEELSKAADDAMSRLDATSPAKEAAARTVDEKVSEELSDAVRSP